MLNSDYIRRDVECALQTLQNERSQCVAHLTQLLAHSVHGREVECCMARIEAINSTLIQLASTVR